MVYKGRDLTQFISGKYLSVKLSKAGITKTRYAHELVMLAFEGVRPSLKSRCEIRHLDGNQLNNCLSNLRYGTTKENAADRKLHARGLVAVK
jgi:HNH endonuclease